ncbi:MAG: glycosyltransferase family 1 protein [Campylobacter sp.]|nr:glycosyltransferase family 1 protein [Campylobacter sp.]
MGLSLIYDATLIANVRGGKRTGTFFVADALLKEFLRRDDISLKIYCRSGDEKQDRINLAPYLGKKNCEIIFVKRHFFGVQFRLFVKVVLRVLPKFLTTFLYSSAQKILALKQKAVVPNKKESLEKTENCVFFSPFFAPPKEYLHLAKFLVIHDVIPLIFLEYKNNPGNYWFLELTRKLDESYTCFANSAYTKTDFLKYLPHLKPENIIVTPLACDERFKPANADEIAKARKKYNIPENKKYIFSLCTLEPRKNLLRTVKCFANFISKNNIDDLVFVLGGAHWYIFISILENEIGSLDENIKSRILKIGYVDDSDQAALYSGALFFVYTSQYEGFGLPPLEAMSCGTPVITSNNSSLPEVVGQAAIMIDYDDDEAHIKAYESYYYDENLRKENSKKGLERAKLFSWEKCADIMITEMKRMVLIKNTQG